jgi:hypothetical protein
MPKNSSQEGFCCLCQGMDKADKAVHLLAVAEAHALPRLAKLAENFLVEHGRDFTACPDISRISRECLLRMLSALINAKENLVSKARSPYRYP